MKNREGVYANSTLGPFSTLENSLTEAVALAEDGTEKTKAELEFQKQQEDLAGKAADKWLIGLGLEAEEEKVSEEDSFFSADIGESRRSHIQAERYNQKLANSSYFNWTTGTDFLDLEQVESSIRMNDYSMDTSGYKEQFGELLQRYRAMLEQEFFSIEEGQQEAEMLMEELDIKEMSLLSADKLLWFSEETMPQTKYGYSDDFYWQADLSEAVPGYRYVFTRAIEGISTEQSSGSSVGAETQLYQSPFPVETLTITVTQDGIKSFRWKGMCEEVSKIAENVKLLSFEEIQSRLVEQIFYAYTEMGQPEEDITKFNYTVISAEFRYTYVTAFDNPSNAWLVPAWIFEVMRSEGAEETKDVMTYGITINAIDGGIII